VFQTITAFYLPFYADVILEIKKKIHVLNSTCINFLKSTP